MSARGGTDAADQLDLSVTNRRGGAKGRIPLLLLVLFVLVGCSALGYQSATISRPRDQVWKELADYKQFVGYVEGYGTALCEVGKIAPDLCAKGKQALDTVKAQIARDEQAALAKGQTVDVQALVRVAGPLLTQYLGTLGLGALKIAPAL